MSSSKKSSPRTSQCSTASEILQSSTSSTKTAKLPSFSNASINGSSTTSGTASASATTNTSAFSMLGIGKKLTKYLRKYYKSTALSKSGNASKRMARQKYVFHRRGLLLAASQTPASSSKSTSSFASKKGIQKWVFACKGCSRPITRDDVKANNAIFAMDEVWHRSHLVCFKCSANIGDEYRPFITSGLKDKHPLCLDCHMEAEHQTCSACNLPLFETCIEFDEKRMHQNCFVCEKCKAPFEGNILLKMSF
uniref:LIM zinc-binding domain-containing protein n=1 Tax=Panagrolaimus davidi TaxID=227884 RepID=A0A914QEZ7_9BILA